MPAKGKHRRPKSPRVTRAAAVASVSGAALALPLIGATGAHAATSNAAGTTSATGATAAAPATARTYTVRTGDSLSEIARKHHVTGGWKRLYKDNSSVIGSDASLIRPGMKLSLDGASVSRAALTTTTATADYVKPVDGPIGTPYHEAGSMWSSGYHTGTDFIVSTGTAVKAVAAGTVVSAGWDGAYGNDVVIRHADGRYSQYAHLSSIEVVAGQSVTAGQQIALSGATGNVTGPHLHFEIRTTPYYGSDVDPLAYLRSHGVSV
ncbi:LysM peptidoglycan-binding domain-containing M23 family metallopeptidase [Streptomyces beihaiensis]|uniref:LysM peptidoglycan-binding domain-containing M23 family metallopeptidase n=1 Tax=Streptomyces beihaiensis TaxID=2984495 RepID=A0ABT3TZD9_9ACTN|nr:LysM peptidoglycan-binding domain-containing M23 family metallopeptidase [Streptomyces beihaiensis]MCX3062418.1 LysM peptidoglycan-binding domain-containing M23 family metallopeptidase [Streptomyces beihaiensis]